MNILNVFLAIVLVVAFVFLHLPAVRYGRALWDIAVFILLLLLVLHVA